MQDKYINPFTDFGFKKLFGEEPNKELLVSFLNALLPEQHQIEDLQYIRSEHQGASSLDRKAIFDLQCISTHGERFLVELQKAQPNYFKDREAYFATFPAYEQVKNGAWSDKQAVVYAVGVLDFVFREDRNNPKVVHCVTPGVQKNQVLDGKLTFVYVVLPHFSKPLGQLTTLQDKWLYIFRDLPLLDERPAVLHEPVFQRLFEVALVAQEERQVYETSVKYYRDLKNVIRTAYEEGVREGKKEVLQGQEKLADG